MKPKEKEFLDEVFGEILEKFCFMFSNLTDKDEIISLTNETASEFIQAKMTFSGHFSGELTVAVPFEMCVEIASNALGMDLDDDNRQECAEDALKELLNVTCGQILISMAGTEPVFDLTVPEVSNLDEKGWLDLVNDDPSVVWFNVDDYPTLVKLMVSQ